MRAIALLAALCAPALAIAQNVSLEYRVKAAYLLNFTKFVEWPEAALPEGAPLTICVAGNNPFGAVLEETIRGETVNGRPIAARTAGAVQGCHVLFVPHATGSAAYLRASASLPVLTVGETDDFLGRGGVVKFILEEGRIRFEINQDAAARAQLRISSRLLRLARPMDSRREEDR